MSLPSAAAALTPLLDPAIWFMNADAYLFSFNCILCVVGPPSAALFLCTQVV